MRHLSLVLGLGALVLVSGCADSKWSLFRSSSTNVRLPADRLLTAPELVNLQNNNARQIPAFVCTHLELDCKQGMVQEVHVPDGKLACQKPRYFRMQAEALARTQAD